MPQNTTHEQAQDIIKPIIERISKISNFDQAASLILELHANHAYYKALDEAHLNKFGADLTNPQPTILISSPLQKKLTELQGGENWDMRGAVDALCRKGESSAGAILLLQEHVYLPSLHKMALSYIDGIKNEYFNARGAQKEAVEKQVIELFSKCVGGLEYYHRANESGWGNGQEANEFVENETVLSFCALLSEKNPFLMRGLALTPKMEFSYFGGEKMSVLDFFGSHLDTNMPKPVADTVLPALGELLWQDQDEKAKEILISFLSRLMQDKGASPELISQTLVASKAFFERCGLESPELSLAREAVKRAILSGSPGAQKLIIDEFMGAALGFQIYESFKRTGSAAVDAILQLEPIADKEILLLCQQVLLTYRYNLDSFSNPIEENAGKIDAYFNSLFDRSLSLQPAERFELLNGVLTLEGAHNFFRDERNKQFLLQLAYDVLVISDELGLADKSPIQFNDLEQNYTRINSSIRETFFQKGGYYQDGAITGARRPFSNEELLLFGERIFESLQGRGRVCNDPTSSGSYNPVQDSREQTLGFLFYFMLLQYSRLPEQERQEKIEKLSRLAIDSEASKELFVAGTGISSADRNRPVLDSYFLDRVYYVGKAEPTPILVSFLKQGSFELDGERSADKAYGEALSLAELILFKPSQVFHDEDEQNKVRQEMITGDKELYEHLFGLYQQETDEKRKTQLINVLAYYPESHKYFEKILFKKNTSEEAKAAILLGFTRNSVQIKGKENLYELLNEEGLKPETRKAILAYVGKAIGNETAQGLAVGLLRNETIDLLERKEALENASLFFAPSHAIWYRLLADYFTSRPESDEKLSPKELMICFSTAIPYATMVEERSTQDYESLRGRLFAAAKKRFFESDENRVLMIAGAYNIDPDWRKDEAISGECRRGILPYLARDFGREGLRAFNDILEEMKTSNLPISQKIAEKLGKAISLSLPENFERYSHAYDEGMQLYYKEYSQRSIPLIDSIFSVNYLPKAYVPGSVEISPGGLRSGWAASADQMLALHLDHTPLEKTQIIKDKYDPVSRGTRILKDGEINRLLSELSAIGGIQAQNPDARYDIYALQIANSLDNRLQVFILNKEQEDVLFEAGKHLLSTGETQIENIIHVLMRNPKGNQKRVEDVLLSEIGKRGETFETGRIKLLEKINSTRVNSALDSVSRDTTLAGGSRAAALNALYEHGQKIDRKLLDDSNLQVRKWAAKAFESNFAEGGKQAVKDAEQSLDPQKQTPGVVREKMAGAVARVDNSESERILGEGLKKETWGTNAAGREYFAVTIELPLVNRAEEGQMSPDIGNKGKVKINMSSYAQTAKVGFINEGGGRDIISPAEVAKELEKSLDEEMPLYLSAMGFDRATIDSVMKSFNGVEINHITSESGILGGEAFGVHQTRENEDGSLTHMIDIDMDETEKLAKKSGFHTKYMYYDVLHHEFMHAVSNTPGVTNQINGHNALHSYLVETSPFSPPIPLDEPLTEFFTTMFEIYGAEAAKALSGKGGEFDEHAEKIGLSYDQIVRQMNDAYGSIAQSPMFVQWLQGVGTQEVFGCYVRGDLDKLKALTADRFGPGAFEQIFPEYQKKLQP